MCLLGRSFTFPFHSSSDLSSLARFPFIEDTLCNSESIYYCFIPKLPEPSKTVKRFQLRGLPSEHFTNTSKGDRSLLFIYCISEIFPHLSALMFSRTNHLQHRRALRIHPCILTLLHEQGRSPHRGACNCELIIGFPLNYQQRKPSSRGVIDKGGSWRVQHWGKRCTLPGAALLHQDTMTHGTETKVELEAVPKKGLWLGQTFLRRVSSHFSAQLHLSLLSWKHAVPSGETRPWEAPSLIITFQPEWAPNHNFSQGSETFFLLFIKCSWLNIWPLSKSHVFRYRIFLLRLLSSTSRFIIFKVRLIIAGEEFWSLFGEKRGKKERQACALSLCQISKYTQGLAHRNCFRQSTNTLLHSPVEGSEGASVRVPWPLA